MSGYGAVPYGWRLAAKRTLEPYEDERALMALAVECSEGLRLSWQETADTLNREGSRNRRGRPWTWDAIRSAMRTRTRHGAEQNTGRLAS